MTPAEQAKIVEILKSLVTTMGKLIQILSRPGEGSDRTGISSRLSATFTGVSAGAVDLVGNSVKASAAFLSTAFGTVVGSVTGESSQVLATTTGIAGNITSSSTVPQYRFGDYLQNGPSRSFFVNRSGLYIFWRRHYASNNAAYRRGNWIDANGVQEGTTPFHGTQNIVGDSGSVGAVWSLNVKDIVQKQITSPFQNKGIYLTHNQSFSVRFHGRLATTVSSRPKLLVQTEAGGVQSLLCLASAYYQRSSGDPVNGTVSFLVGGDANTFVQFDLAQIVGTTVSTATLELTVSSLNSTQRTYGFQAFEADPPLFLVAGSIPGTSVQGHAQNYEYDRDMYGTHADIIFARDFTGSVQGVSMPWKGTPGTANTTQYGYTITGNDASDAPPNIGGKTYAEFEVRPETGTTIRKSYAHDNLSKFVYPESLVGVQTNTTIPPRPVGSPTVTRANMRYYMRVVDPWDSQLHVTKWMGFDSRFGYWTSAGFWQSVSGNSGGPGSGTLHQGSDGKWAFFGNSQRGHLGKTRNALVPEDPHPYDKLVDMGAYLYHLDMYTNVGDHLQWGYSQNQRLYADGINRTCTTDVGPHVATVYDTVASPWVCVEWEILVNTVAGPLDAYNNGEANADGRLKFWVDGILVGQLDNFRITRNTDYGIEAAWFLSYYGGNPNPWNGPWPANYYLDNIVTTRNGLYIGPRGEGSTLPLWASSMVDDEFKSLGGEIGQHFTPLCTPWDSFYSRKILRDFSGGVYNPHWGALGAFILHGGGHASTNDNSVYLLDLNDMNYKRVSQHSFGTGVVADQSSEVADSFGQNSDGLPSAAHTYDSLAILPPSGSAPLGSLIRVPNYFLNHNGTVNSAYAQTFEFASLTQTTGTWTRGGTTGTDISNGGANVYDPTRNRVWWVAFTSSPGTSPYIRWFDVSTQTHGQTSYTGPNFGVIATDCPTLRYDPVNDMLILAGPLVAQLKHRIFYLRCTNPAAGWTEAALSSTITSSGGAGTSLAFDYCTHNGKWYGIASPNKTQVYEITVPTNGTGTWTVTPRTVSGSTNWTGTMFVIGKRWSYVPAIKRFMWVADVDFNGNDVLYAYRPPGV